MTRVLFSLCLGLLAPTTPAVAHPHLFFDTGLRLVLNDAGALAAVQVTWVYDELYSLSIVAERGMDPDADGALTEAERATLAGFDNLGWDEGFEGDLYVTLDGLTLPLLPPAADSFGADMQDGRVISTHTRVLADPVALSEALAVRVYDPTFFASHSLIAPIRLSGDASCTPQIILPDADAAYVALEEELAKFGAQEDLEEMGYPEVGGLFAEEVRFQCP